MNIEYKKIIINSFGEQNAILIALARYFKEKNCRIYIVCRENDHKQYMDLVDDESQLVRVPEFYEMQDWERDPQEVLRVDALMRSCEAHVNFPMNQLLLAAERNIGRGYSERFYHFPPLKIVRKALKNNSLPSRILSRYFWFAHKTLTALEPDLILGGAKGDLWALSLHYSAMLMNIPFLSRFRSYMCEHRHFWTSDAQLYNMKIDAVYKNKYQSKLEVSDRSKAYMKSFREKPKTSRLMQNYWDEIGRDKFKRASSAIKVLAIDKVAAFLFKKYIYHTQLFFSCVFYRYMTILRSKSHTKFFSIFTPDELGGMRYIYYPLHQVPEFTLNVQAPFWYDQINTIKLLSQSLPYGYKLLVRENRFNDGRRPRKLIKEILKIPNVCIVNPFDSQFKYLENADLIVTENGTSGLEGMLLDRPVLTLDKTYYDSAKLTAKLQKPADLFSVIYRLIKNKQPDVEHFYRLGLLFDAEWDASISDSDGFEADMKYISEIISMKKNKASSKASEKHEVH